jgi:hypothetical protein
VVVFYGAVAFGQQPAMRSVYVLPMAGGLDQYLAAQLAHDHVMQVVADPKIADAVLTDRLGDSFQQTLAKLHPRDDDEDTSEAPRHSFQSTGTKGTVFLVDAKSRQVIWSDFEKPPRNVSGNSLNRHAERLAKKLQGLAGK